MPNRKHISGLHAARAADEFARREPVKWVSSAQEEGKQVVALTPAPAIGAKKGPPRLRKASGRSDALVAPIKGLEEHKAALRQVFGETLSDEFVDVMLTKLVLYQNSKTLTHATYAATGTSIAKTYGSPVGYGRLARARTVVQMSQCLRSLVLHVTRGTAAQAPRDAGRPAVASRPRRAFHRRRPGVAMATKRRPPLPPFAERYVMERPMITPP